jgi:predicted acetyltransferase
MHELEIRELETRDKEAFQRYVDEIVADTNPYRIFPDIEMYKALNFEEFDVYVNSLKREKSVTIKPDWSTMTTYFGFLDGEIVGEIKCRWQIDKGILFKWGGHIGYVIAPRFRGHRYAEIMLRFVLEKYRERGILHVMVSAHEGNMASRTTIERCGGVLENIVDIDGENICRYWITLTPTATPHQDSHD